MKKNIIVAQTAVITLLLLGCSPNKLPKWLSGEWVFDPEATMKNFSQGISGETINISDGLRSFLIPGLKGMAISFSEDGQIVSFQGKRTLKEFEVFEKEAGKITLKQSDGSLRDFHKTQDGFWTLSDDGQIQLFFKRKVARPDKDHGG